MCKIGFIGTGTVGSAIALLLHEKGYTITGVCSKKGFSSAALADKLGCSNLEEPAEVLAGTQVVFLTVPDGQLDGMAYHLAESGKVSGEHIFLHMSGALPAEVLAPLKELGAAVGSLHPLQSFASIEKAVDNLPGSFFAVQGDEKAVEFAIKTANALNGRPFTIGSSDKALYHLGAAVASNYLVALVHFAVKIFNRIGMSDEQATDALLPLIRGTVANIEILGPVKALTGPVSRGDVDTIERHLSAMGDLDKVLCKLYRTLGIYTTRIAVEKGSIDGYTAESLLNTFREEEKRCKTKE